MFITPAFAQGAQVGAGDLMNMVTPFLAVILIMYFLVIRPQQVRQKKHREMIAALRRGASIVTAGGLHAKVTKVISDAELQVEIADGVRVRIERATVSEVRTPEGTVKGK